MKRVLLNMLTIICIAATFISCNKDESNEVKSIEGIWWQAQTDPIFFNIENKKGTVDFMSNPTMPNSEFVAFVKQSINKAAPFDMKTLEFKKIAAEQGSSANMSAIITYVDRETGKEGQIAMPCTNKDGELYFVFKTQNLPVINLNMRYRLDVKNGKIELFGDGTMFPGMIDQIGNNLPDEIKPILQQIKTIIEESDKIELGLNLEKR